MLSSATLGSLLCAAPSSFNLESSLTPRGALVVIYTGCGYSLSALPREGAGRRRNSRAGRRLHETTGGGQGFLQTHHDQRKPQRMCWASQLFCQLPYLMWMCLYPVGLSLLEAINRKGTQRFRGYAHTPLVLQVLVMCWEGRGPIYGPGH